MLASSAALRAQTPEWIWHPNNGESPKDNEARFFRKAFQAPAGVAKAVLIVSGDNRARAFLNGKQVADNRAWERPATANVTAEIKAGENILAIRGANEGGIAAMVARLELTLADGSTQWVVTDTSWKAGATEENGWQNAGFAAGPAWVAPVSLGKLGVSPWGDVMAARVATPVEKITAAPGFQVELVRSAEGDEGSWVSMTVDDKGRLIVSPQDGVGNMLRLTLANGKVEKLERIEQPVGSAMGLLHANGRLYVSGRGPSGLGLYLVRDTNGDDQYDEVKLAKRFDGADGEHGSHALALGPDKKIYYLHGNFVRVPEDIAATSPHRNFAEDQVLPRAEDGNGFGVGVKPPGGFLLRSDANGEQWELVAAGMRNAYDFDFNAEGEMFTYDSDMEWDWGMPWYRPTRIYHLVSGGDYGFREGTAKWPAHYSDGLPPTLNVGIGSPTGVKFGTGSQFPAKYQKALYAMDWSYGRIFAVHLSPRGSTYNATKEVFIHGQPLNVTDLEIGRDGAMYFTTGGRGTQSGLYRVTYTGGAALAAERAHDEEAAEARELRRKLESYHSKQDPAAVEFLWPHLASEDRWIRYAARIALERQDPAVWARRAMSERNPPAAMTALLALARISPQSMQLPLLREVLRFPLSVIPEDLNLEKLRVIQVSLARQGSSGEAIRSELLAALGRSFPSSSDFLNRELAQILIRLEAPDAAAKTMALAARASTQEELVHYLFHLRTLKAGWTDSLRREYFDLLARARSESRHSPEVAAWFREAGREYGEGASVPKFIENMRKDAVALLTDAQKTELAAHISGKPAPAAPKPAAPREFVKEWTMADLMPELGSVSSGRSFAKGKEAYVAAQCAACHRFGHEGGDVGPDLTAISSRFARRDLLESIIEPSKVISEQYHNLRIFLKDGEELTGRIVEENDQRIVVLTNPLTQEKAEASISAIQKREPSKLSPMPEGLVNSLSKEEILDLLAYLESAGNKNHSVFQKR